MLGQTDADALTGTLVGLVRTLRAAGVVASPDRVHTFVAALGTLGAADRDAVYWAGRLTLCANPDELARYDQAFDAYFRGERPPPRLRRPAARVVRPALLPASEQAADPGDQRPDDDNPVRAALASDTELLRRRDLARLTGGEREEVRRLIAAVGPRGPLRVSRRRRASSSGPVAAQRTVRAMLRRGGEVGRLEHHRRAERPRRLVLVLDVSGSMQPYADALLRFAHAAARARPGTEVFTVGTRLTRVTRELRLRDPDAALVAVSMAVPDWSGGTRLGEQLKAFLDRWGQRGTARGAVVVLASDGWERGDPALLGEQMARLHRLAHRVVWVNPHKGKAGYAPEAAGMAAALPSVDDFVEGHTLAALEDLAEVLSARRRGRGARA